MGKPQRKRDVMRSRHVRLADSIWRKLNWRATERGLPLADALRGLIADGLKDQQPPKGCELLDPEGSAAERERWIAAAKQRGLSVDAFARFLLNGAAARLLDKND